MAQGRQPSPLELAWRHTKNIMNPFLSAEQDAKLVASYRANFPLYAKKYLRIVDDNSNVVPFVMRRCQRVLHIVVEELLKNYGYVRALVPKARQTGVCLAPETKVLTDDLRWVEIDSLAEGDGLVSVEEYPEGRGASRKMKRATVEFKHEVFEPAFLITLDDGRTLTATAQHRFLCKKRNYAGRGKKSPEGGYAYTHESRWCAVGDMVEGDFIRYITTVWDEPTYEDGWFGGLLDGEGHLALATRAGASVDVCQVEGHVIDRAIEYLSTRGYSYRVESDERRQGLTSKLGNSVVYRLIISRMDEMFHLMGRTRSSRWQNRLWWENKGLPGRGVGRETKAALWGRVVSIEPLGVRRMIDIQTSTSTFIAEGFVSHNSAYVQARASWRMRLWQNTDARLVSNSVANARKVLGFARMYHAKLPEAIRPPFFENTKDRMVWGNKDDTTQYEFPGLMSSLEVSTAANPHIGRGSHHQFLHLCLATGTYVLVGDGRVKKVEDLQYGDRVLTHTGAESIIVQTLPTTHDQVRMVRVLPWLGEELCVTHNHPFWTKRGWVKAEDLKKTDWLSMPVRRITNGETPSMLVKGRGYPGNHNRQHETGILPETEDVGFAIGYYLAEGCLAYTNKGKDAAGIVFSHDRDVVQYADRVRATLAPWTSGVGRDNSKISRSSNDTVYSAGLAELFCELFGNKDEKRIPDWVFSAGRDFCRGILLGYLSGDGSRSYNKKTYDSPYITATSVRASLVTQIRDLAASLGFGWGSIRHKEGGVLYGRNCKEAWILGFSGDAARKLRHALGYEASATEGRPRTQKYEWTDDHVWIRIRSLETSVEPQTVWDVEVEHPDHSFRTLHCAVKNSEIGLYGAKVDEVLQAVLPSLHDYEPDTYGFLESTSAGSEGGFYDRVMRARDDMSSGARPEWYPVFLPAWLEERYYDELTDEEVAKIILECDPYELGLLKKYKFLWTPRHVESVEEIKKLKPPATTNDLLKLNPRGAGFISWRRKKLISLGGNKSALDREFAPSLEEFFAATGQTLFDKSSLLFYKDKTVSKTGGEKGRLVVPSGKSGVVRKPVWVPDPNGPLTIWKHPRPGLYYAAGSDGAIGKKADPDMSDEETMIEAQKEDRDYSTCVVLDCFMEQVAEYNSNVIEAKMFGNELYNLGVYYNYMTIMPETGNQSAGYAILDRLMALAYPKIGRWEKPDSTKYHKYMEAYGWEVNDKCEKNSSFVPTPEGWRRFGDLGVGDFVQGRKGWTQVTAIHEQGVKKMFRVHFTDGVFIDCSKGHRWGVYDRRFRTSVKTVQELLDLGLREEGKGWRWRVPLIETPVEYAERKLPLDPYTLGMFLGNGSFTGATSAPSFSSCEPELYGAVKLPGGVRVSGPRPHKDSKSVDWTYPRDTYWDHNPLVDSLMDLGLWGHNFATKFIPKVYLIAPFKDRLALLQGLMDTDGHASTKGDLMLYSTGSLQLAKDVQELVQSMGGLSVIKTTPFKGKDYYKVSVNVPRDIMPFRLTRKRQRVEAFRAKSDALPLAHKTSRLVRSICAIEEIEEAECRCIGVEAADGLYATSHYVLTHNTKQTLIADLQFEIMRGAGRCYTNTAKDEEGVPKLVLRSLELLRQLQVFAYHSGGAIGAKRGHDDLVMALGLALIALRQAGGALTRTVVQEMVEYADDDESDGMTFWEV